MTTNHSRNHRLLYGMKLSNLKSSFYILTSHATSYSSTRFALVNGISLFHDIHNYRPIPTPRALPQNPTARPWNRRTRWSEWLLLERVRSPPFQKCGSQGRNFTDMECEKVLKVTPPIKKMPASYRIRTLREYDLVLNVGDSMWKPLLWRTTPFPGEGVFLRKCCKSIWIQLQSTCSLIGWNLR